MATTQLNPDTAPKVLETYALLQIAAEAMFGVKHPEPAAAAGSGALTNPGFGIDGAVLITGNDHSSKMTAAQAKQFSEEWTVVSHQPNTATGFSGTLFQYQGVGDPSRGLRNSGSKFRVRSQIQNSGSNTKFRVRSQI